MFNKRRFCYLAGTGRTATHWVKRLIDESCPDVATFHDAFPKRAKVGNRPNAAAFFRNYLLNLKARQPDATVYIECNPALLEHAALTYGIRSAYGVFPAGMVETPPRSVFLVRHPFTYAASLKAKGWGWRWWDYPQAGSVYGVGAGFGSRGIVEQAARAWRLKNEFYHSLTRLGAPMLRFELLFDRNVSKEQFTEQIEGILDGFGLVPIQGPALWWKLRDQRAAGKAKGEVVLTAAEKTTVKRLVGPAMETFGYA